MCDSPFYVQPTKWAPDKIPVPCGRCPPCKLRRVNQWVFRMMQEEKISTSSHFVTLTYDTTTVPISDNGFMTLKKKDFQDYMKRLRKLTPGVTLKYYAVGEYGSKNRRPHYHAIIFNCPDPQLFYDAWSLAAVPIGAVHIGNVTTDSVAYTMKYIDKQTFKRAHSRDDRISEFSLMSKGLGANYLTDNMVEYHKKDTTMLYVTKLSGHRVSMPRYYRNKIFTDAEKRAQVFHVQEVMSDLEQKDRLEVSRQFGDRMTYEEVKDSEKYGRYKKFYNSQNSNNRKL